MKTKVEYGTGFTLTYEGVQFTEEGIQYSDKPLSKLVEHEGKIPSKTFQFCEDFNNVGALIMRFHFGQSQRSASLTQVVRSNYKDYAIDKIGEGADQTDFFDVPQDVSNVIKDNLKLHQLSSYPLGEAKILNRLTQAVYERNSMICGEQGLFGTIHTAVWQPVLALPGLLTKNDFIYVPCLLDISPTEYKEISEALNDGNFLLDEDKTKLTVKERTIDLNSLSDIKIQPQLEKGLTFQDNELLVTSKKSKGAPAPLGWIIHLPSKRALAQVDTEDLMKLIRLAEGKFHQLTPAQQKILMSGRLEDNERVRVIQNRQLNVMLSIFATLEKDFNFDPTPLINNVLKQIAKTTRKYIEETNVLDDFLTGFIQTAMIQHLVVTQEKSKRTELPVAFQLGFKAIENNAKALAYAFNMKDGNGVPVLHLDEEECFYQDKELPDLGMKGVLLAPSLTDSRHCAALLSTAILVAEQMILEQLLTCVFQKESNEEYLHTFQSLLKICQGKNSQNAYEDLYRLASKCKESEDGIPLLGLQYEHCAELITALRSYIGTDVLIHFASQLGTEEHSTPEKIVGNIPPLDQTGLIKSLEHLHLICSELQSLPGISAAKVGSGGAVLGTSLIIAKLFPDLAKSLGINENQAVTVPIKTDREIDKKLIIPTLSACPYLKAKQREYNAPCKNRNTFFMENKVKTNTTMDLGIKSEVEQKISSSKQKSSSLCKFFIGATITTLGIGGTILALGLGS
ncbi:Dot/Icm T4SS effector Ceg17 [Legionella longbeachae]|uniref:Dot/Icm T4SS effector Ceg17 n=1 Tax=Legionella longbeachae TaxID=450 RepID=UPI000A1C1802|nr:Dot/Icm T4SS effector Ceg17 [Legionella longbeachae]ARM35242.1 hypothetical protein B0B39_17765 [Legionella longbeachae]HBD7396668.1 hypothetical protein [Legionella pneumophila]